MSRILHVISAVSLSGGSIVKMTQLVESDSIHNHSVYFAWYTGSNQQKDQVKQSLTSRGVKVYGNDFGRNILKHINEIAKIVNRENIHILHFYHNFETAFVLLLRMIFPKITMVRSFEGYDGNLSFIKKIQLKLALLQVNNVIYISNYVKKSNEKLYNLLKNKNSKVIYNSPAKIPSDKLPQIINKKDLICISSLVPCKNLKVLIEAMGYVIRLHNKDIKLHILGEGYLRTELENYIHELKLENNVFLVGTTNKPWEYIRQSKLYVHPCDVEGFGLAIAEAMYVSSCIIGAHAGAIPELIKDGVSGFLVDPYNAMDWANKIFTLYDDDETICRIGDNAHRRAIEKFSVSNYIKGYDSFYSEILKN